MDDSGVSVLDAFIKDALTAQDQRKASFEQRGLAVITTSGALATLLLALAALSTTKQTTLVLPGSAKPWLIAALILFFVSAVAALGTNVPLRYQTATPSEIKKQLDANLTTAAAVEVVAYTHYKELKSARCKNSIKGWLLVAALAAEAAAVGCIAFAVGLTLGG